MITPNPPVPNYLPKYHELDVQNFKVLVHLGCTAEERRDPQTVLVSTKIRFLEAPKGVETDQLDHTLCYANACQWIQQHLTSQEFNLIEKMGYDCFQILKKNFHLPCLIRVSIHKVSPPVDNLTGGVVYSCGDLEI